MGNAVAKLDGKILWRTLKSQTKEFGIRFQVWVYVCKIREIGIVAIGYSRVPLV